MTPADAAAWLRVRRPLAAPRARLLCLPYAGGAATLFHTWPDGLPADVEVRAAQLPGRQDRLSHPTLTSLPAIIERLVEALAALPPAPLVLYGHSFGALLAFELTRRLRAAGQPPRGLIVGGRRAPHLPPIIAPLHQLSDPDFKEELHRRYGTPRAVLQDAELMGLALPSLRADFTALETHQHQAAEPLALPMTVLRGRHDTSVPAEDAAAWRDHAAGAFALHEVDAGHFFVDSHRPWVVAQVAEALRAALV